MNLKIISAGAGSGKTYTLTQKMAALLKPDAQGKSQVRASGILATTFTRDAAAELQERVRVKLLEEGLTKQADELGNALIGTVHSIGTQLLKRISFEAGVSPDLSIIEDESGTLIFNQSLSSILTQEVVEEMDSLSFRLGLQKKKDGKDWRDELRNLVSKTRENNLGREDLEQSKAHSIHTFLSMFQAPLDKKPEVWEQELRGKLKDAITTLQDNEDSTKKTEDKILELRILQAELDKRPWCWYEWVKAGKAAADVGAKSKEDAAPLREFCESHTRHLGFHQDINDFISNLFDLTIKALDEYESYKKQRGLIDYNDMEVLILRLLDNALVASVLKEELDLLLVDEFQDTSPLQLKIFLRLTGMAKQSIWVGDPKQSIYGFRGADPALMEAILKEVDEHTEVLTHSWRSRPDLVEGVNGLFVRAFSQLPAERVALIPACKDEPDLDNAHHIWYLAQEDGKTGAKDWAARALASALRQRLEEGTWRVRVRGGKGTRPMRAGDVAILCRSNGDAQTLAQALSQEGLEASIARGGLLSRPEVSLMTACLKFVLNPYDSLSIAEILLLGEKYPLQEIIDQRIDFLERQEHKNHRRDDSAIWAEEQPFIQTLKALRRQVSELSAAEILDLLIAKLGLRQILARWTQARQRLDNLEALRALALDYEDRCNRLHTAATLGGFLLWLNDLQREGGDGQGQSQGADSVQILTYHKSKGLEWPMVICYSLDNKFRADLLGLRVVSLRDKIDLQDPLAGRLLCYWPNPYDDQSQKTELSRALEQHPEAKLVEQQALKEEARLMYVGLTRARDYLVLVQNAKKPNLWLNRVFHREVDAEKNDCISYEAKSLPWPWNEREIALSPQTFVLPKVIGSREKALSEAYFFSKSQGPGKHGLALFDQASALFPQADFRIIDGPKFFAPALPAPKEGERWDFDRASLLLNQFLRADRPRQTFAARLQKAEAWLSAQPELAHLEPSFLLNYAQKTQNQAFNEIEEEANLRFDVDFIYREGGQYFRGRVDVWYQPKQGPAVLLLYSQHNNLDLPRRKNKVLDEAYVLLAACHALKIQGPLRFCIVAAAEGLFFEIEDKANKP